jgi:rod shape-determining protein MreC
MSSNSYQNYIYTEAANTLSGSVYSYRNDVTEYIHLESDNERLLAENQRLRNELMMYAQKWDSLPAFDSLNELRLKSAEVVNNSFLFQNNFLTINKGTKDGLVKGMSVIGPDGLVGQIKNCSENYCTVYSLLHSNQKVSAKDKNNGALGTIRWRSKDPSKVTFEDVPRYINILRGDTIVTSSYNAIHPKNVMIGVVEEVRKEGTDLNQKAIVKLSTDFTSLNYVYVVGSEGKAEKDSLEADLIRGDKIQSGEIF